MKRTEMVFTVAGLVLIVASACGVDWFLSVNEFELGVGCLLGAPWLGKALAAAQNKG